jgi:RNA polymerase-binding transcription factor DksA
MSTFASRAEARLREERASLLHQLEELGSDESGELSGDYDFGEGFADAAAVTAERTEVLGVLETLKRTVDNIDAALERIGEGKYGICAGCGKPIGQARLEFRPESIYCVECKSKSKPNSH